MPWIHKRRAPKAPKAVLLKLIATDLTRASFQRPCDLLRAAYPLMESLKNTPKMKLCELTVLFFQIFFSSFSLLRVARLTNVEVAVVETAPARVCATDVGAWRGSEETASNMI